MRDAGDSAFSAILSIAQVRTGSFGLFNYVGASAGVLLVSSVLLATFFVLLYRQKRQEYLLVWSGAWLLTSLYLLTAVLDVSGSHSRSQALSQWLLIIAALAFYA